MPSAFELLAEEHPMVFESIAVLHRRLAEPAGEPMALRYNLDAAASEPRGSRSVSAPGQLPEGVLAVAAAAVAGLVEPTLVVEITEPLVRAHAGDLSEPPTDDLSARLWSVREAAAAAIGFGPEGLAVIGMPRPVAQVGPGDECHGGVGPSTFGTRVTTHDNRRAILAAGHGAPVIGSFAYDAGSNRIGQVVDSVDCTKVGPRVQTPDVAVVVLDGSVPDTGQPALGAVTVGAARPWDDVVVNGAVTPSGTASILTVAGAMAGPTRGSGDWGVVMTTMRAFSSGGDSGAPVYNAATGELVGHIVGGYPGVSSVIQDATYQLNAFQASVR